MLRPRSWLAALALSAATLALVAGASAAPNDAVPARPQPLVIGAPAPPIQLTHISGAAPITLDALAGRVVILDFWATWCSPCRAVMPVLDAMYQQRNGEGLSIVGVSPEPEPAIRSHVATHPVHYTVARDAGGTVRAYGVRGIPMLVVLDRGGKVREIFTGVDQTVVQRLDTLVTALLAEPSP
ncbi:MAG: TlpA family protein disulfide reductase [Sandaracinaceae bacterium]